jgi:hypothetical protein
MSAPSTDVWVALTQEEIVWLANYGAVCYRGVEVMAGAMPDDPAEWSDGQREMFQTVSGYALRINELAVKCLKAAQQQQGATTNDRHA